MGFAQHPDILRLLEAGRRLTTRTLVLILYHCDLPTMYPKHGEFQKVRNKNPTRGHAAATNKQQGLQKQHGLATDHVSLHGDAIEALALEYTHEAGVRKLEQQIAAVKKNGRRPWQ